MMIDGDIRRSGFLFASTLLGSAVWWWPWLALWGRFDGIGPQGCLPFWVPFSCVALFMCLSVALVPSRWPLLLLASGIGSFGGVVLSAIMWPVDDPIAQTYVLFVAAGIACVLMLFGLLATLIIRFVGFTTRSQSISNTRWRRAIWVAILVWVASGLLSLTFAPTLIRHRIARNDQLAAERFASLKDAYETAVKTYGVSQISGGMALKGHYFGPTFSNMNWKGFVKQDGYRFIINGAKSGGYTIWAEPLREHLDGTRRFCTDESGKMGCRVEWDGSRSRCAPCPK